MDWKAWLQAQGFTEEEFGALEPKMQKVLKASYGATNVQPQVTASGGTPPAPPAPPVNANGSGTPPTPPANANFDQIDAEIKDIERRQAIAQMAVDAVRASGEQPDVAKRIRDLAATAVDQKWSTQRFDTELLRAQRPQGGFRPINRDGIAVSQTMLTAAALMSTLRVAGDQLIRAYGEQAVEAADRKFRSNLSLHEMIRECARANGYTGRDHVTDGTWHELVLWAGADPRMIRAAGMSTVDLSGILGAVANKALAAVAAQPAWVAPRISGTANHANFHAHTVYSLAMNGELLEVGANGELKHLNLSEESWTRQVGTRGAILGLDRKQIINDDLGVFTKNATALAIKSYTAREKAAFVLLNATAAGSSHFTAARGNYLSGLAFGAAGMDAAVAAFRGMTGPDGDPITAEPALVVVPKGLESPANRLLKPGGSMIATVLLDAVTPVLDANSNIYEGRFDGRALTSPYMDLASIAGSSATAWYLLADPAYYPTLEIAYLNGMQTPTVTFFGLDTNPAQLGMTWQVFFDFGVALAEWRAGVKSAGA